MLSIVGVSILLLMLLSIGLWRMYILWRNRMRSQTVLESIEMQFDQEGEDDLELLRRGCASLSVCPRPSRCAAGVLTRARCAVGDRSVTGETSSREARAPPDWAAPSPKPGAG